MKKVSNRKPANKTAKSAARSFILDYEAAQKMQLINCDQDSYSLVRDDKGQMFTRIYRPEIKKGGKWRPLPESTWSGNVEMEKIGWPTMAAEHKRIMYKMTPVTQLQALKWLIYESVQHEFKADFLKMFQAACCH